MWKGCLAIEDERNVAVPTGAPDAIHSPTGVAMFFEGWLGIVGGTHYGVERAVLVFVHLLLSAASTSLISPERRTTPRLAAFEHFN